MKQVQDALKDIGIPVMAGVWRATSARQNPPVQYAVYSTTTTEASHQDDLVTSYLRCDERILPVLDMRVIKHVT